MRPSRLFTRLRHSLMCDVVAALGLAAFLLTALIPQGYMPSGAGGFALKMCSSSGPAPAGLKDTAPREGGAAGASGCQFALLPLAVAPTPGLPVHSPFDHQMGGVGPAEATRIAPAGPLRAHAARAPPLAA
jgi:hypothetical protein